MERLYHQVAAQGGEPVETVAASTMRTVEELLDDLGPLCERGIVEVVDGRLVVAPPGDAVRLMLTAHAAAAADAARELQQVAAAMPYLSTPAMRPSLDRGRAVEPIDGELVTGGDVIEIFEQYLLQSRGDMLWLRPDTWQGPYEGALTGAIARAIATGRRSRAIYPVRALRDAQHALATRAGTGEEIRVLPDVPTRMMVIGSFLAVLPEPLGYVDEPRTVVRQRGLIEALTMWFDQLWAAASPVPGLERAQPRPDLRRLLLQELASGAQDEQIARRLDVSLRTVRRRVADLLHELGADTRFQAGAEAARRGWL